MGLFKSKLEFLKANYNTTEGIFEFLIYAFVFGFIIVNYTDNIFLYITNFLPLTNPFLLKYIGYLIFGLVILPLDILITYVAVKLYKVIFKRNKIIIQ